MVFTGSSTPLFLYNAVYLYHICTQAKISTRWGVGGFFLDINGALAEKYNENLIIFVEVGALQPYY